MYTIHICEIDKADAALTIREMREEIKEYHNELQCTKDKLQCTKDELQSTEDKLQANVIEIRKLQDIIQQQNELIKKLQNQK